MKAEIKKKKSIRLTSEELVLTFSSQPSNQTIVKKKIKLDNIIFINNIIEHVL